MMTELSTEQPLASAPPLVSIVAPCYNAEKFLEDAMASIFAQDYENFEVIVVDDGSTDNSFALLQSLQSKYTFQLYQQENQGVSAALNHGMQYAKGTYVATPDLDDIMLPDSVRVRAEYLDKHPHVGCVGALIIYMDSEGRDTKRQHRDYIEYLKFEQVLRGAVVVGAPVALYRLDAIKAAGFYDPNIRVQDFQMTLKIAHQGYCIDVLPVCVTRYRRHANNLSRKYKVLLDADLQTIAPYKSHRDYHKGRTLIVHKALKYAVVSDKKHAWSLLRSIPLRHMNMKTLTRFKRLVLSH
ncbi:glycosyltransferase family 2 protein [Pseudomonas viridiflava]|uniref:glycosyltransferase family 2 protein n=1 Tax=Pseudomonas viridiflava TaxID=33069 RepID=UPI000F0516D5|nr:glycosyltransferase family 2 protein [Pseudomonas viridiflava]